MFQCIIENEYGEQLELTNNKNYTVYKIEGLEPTNATINTSPVANFDGSRYNSARTNERNIVIYLVIEGNCESNRINLYKYVRTKRYIKMYYKNTTRDVYAEGYVESMPIGYFEMKQTIQISILCPHPYFKSVHNDVIDFSSLISQFIFPFAYEESGAPFSMLEINREQPIINSGDIENGVVITIQAVGTVLNPVIYNFSKNEFFRLNMELSVGDQIVINTNRSQKRITYTHDGENINAINYMDRGSTWFELLVGDNIFGYGADEFPENLLCTLTHCDEYEGV